MRLEQQAFFFSTSGREDDEFFSYSRGPQGFGIVQFFPGILD